MCFHRTFWKGWKSPRLAGNIAVTKDDMCFCRGHKGYISVFYSKAPTYFAVQSFNSFLLGSNKQSLTKIRQIKNIYVTISCSMHRKGNHPGCSRVVRVVQKITCFCPPSFLGGDQFFLPNHTTPNSFTKNCSPIKPPEVNPVFGWYVFGVQSWHILTWKVFRSLGKRCVYNYHKILTHTFHSGIAWFSIIQRPFRDFFGENKNPRCQNGSLQTGFHFNAAAKMQSLAWLHLSRKKCRSPNQWLQTGTHK